MKKHLFLSLLVLRVACSGMAQTLPPLSATLKALNPQNVFPADPSVSYTLNDRNKETTPTLFTVAQANGGTLMTAEVPAATPSHYNIQVSWKNEGPINRGDVLLARMNIRAVYAKQESGDAVVNFYTDQAVAPNDRSVLIELSVGPEWRTIDVPFTAVTHMPAGEAKIGFTLGALAQKVEIANLQLLNFGKSAAVAQLPVTKLTYAGREPDAAWRKEALKRIEEIRTAPLQIQVKDAAGKAVKGATVKATLVDPEFIFGSAVSANQIVKNDTASAKYRRHILELFNAVTIGNHLKWPVWRDPKNRETTAQAIDWILANGLKLRGHNLVWPGKKFTPEFFSRQPGFGPSFADSITAHIKDIATFTRGKVYGWDVINEMMHEKDYFTVMPRTEAAKWFQLAKQYDPKATLYINEYSMLNNVASPKNIENYLAIIEELQGYGAPIEGIGVQGHVGRQPRAPVQVLSDLDLFKSTGLPVQITEFDVNTPDNELQADYVRDFLIACYSHPVVNGFTMWGFWEADHWKPDAALYRRDWTPKPAAAVWREWVAQKWRTDVSATTGAGGDVKTRGHLGRYEVTVSKGNKTVKQAFVLTKDKNHVQIKL